MIWYVRSTSVRVCVRSIFRDLWRKWARTFGGGYSRAD